MKTETQNKAIYSYLKAGCKITSLEALTMFGCFRLSARIFDIRNEILEPGETIQTETITKNGKHFTQYSLK